MEPGRGGGQRGQRVRARLAARAGLVAPTDLEQRSVDVRGMTRSFSIARARRADAPLLIVLHGAGGTGAGMAALTHLHERGPSAGFTVAFPDGVHHVWNDHRGAPGLRSREGVDDVAFLAALVDDVGRAGAADPARVALTGISNGAFLSEHVARHGRIPVKAIVLVAGTATAISRAAMPAPARPTAVMLFSGTADPLVPYAGGPIGFGRLLARAAADGTGEAPRGVAVAAEVVAADWAAANGLPTHPVVDRDPAPGDLPVTRLSWTAPGRPSVILHRIEGGGHTWPGGAPYLPARIIGPVAKHLDATGIALDFLARSV